jgi:hypothetical protein
MELHTGDIILLKGNAWYSKLIEYFGYSKYSHVAMVLKDPTFIRPDMKGLYVIESGYEGVIDITDNKTKYGVQVNKYEDFINKVKKCAYYRKLNVSNEIRKNFYEKLKNIYKIIYDKPYDINILDWIKAEKSIIDNKYKDVKRTDCFWCSALVAYIYQKLGLIEDCSWSLVAPREFSGEGKLLKFKNCNLGNIIKM